MKLLSVPSTRACVMKPRLRHTVFPYIFYLNARENGSTGLYEALFRLEPRQKYKPNTGFSQIGFLHETPPICEGKSHQKAT